VGHPDGQPVTDDIRTYLERYGHQVYTLDFAEPTQGEDPRPVLSSLKVLAAADDLDTAARQAAMVRTRDRLADETARSLGPIRRRLFRRFLKWAQASGPHREEALFYMGAAWPTLRRLALELGARLVTAGTLSAPDDLFYLETQEVVAACTARGEG
jgi:pyruvate,water dikinase